MLKLFCCNNMKRCQLSRVGLSVIEEIINADEDESLNDNAQGFSNYSAPGADRLKITANLTSKLIS